MKEKTDFLSRIFKKMPEASWPLIVGALLLLAGVVAIEYFFFGNRLPNVPSLEENWAVLEGVAREWQGDAYPTSITLPVTDELFFETRAVYRSYDTTQVLLVRMDQAGKTTSQVLEGAQASELPKSPIRRQDWVIDSREALEMFAQDAEIRTCLVYEYSQAELTLAQTSTDAPAWSFTAHACPGAELPPTVRMDPLSGEILR